MQGFRLPSLSLVSFRHLSALGRDRLIYNINIISFEQVANISYRFLSSLSAWWSFVLKYDIFRYGDEGTWQKHPD